MLKNNLLGKYVGYRDNDGKFRTERVVKIVGNTLTVKNALGYRRRVHLSHVVGVYRYRKYEKIEARLR